MARIKASSGSSAAHLKKLQALLHGLPPESPVGREKFRSEVLQLVKMTDGLRALARTRLSALSQSTAAIARILAYLKLFTGEVLEGKELAVVSGIQEYARRVRELRVQFGYSISTGITDETLNRDQYRLDSAAPDAEAAAKWKLMNDIRKMKGAGMDRALELLKALVGKPVSGDHIKYVAKIRSAERRVRQLRTEYGWRIATKKTGRIDLPNDMYVLESKDQLPPHDRKIPDKIYDEVLDRDNSRCRYCGWSAEQRTPSGKRQFLEVHHVIFHHKGGGQTADNLVTLCNVDHDEVHRRELQGAELRVWLKSRESSRATS